MRASASRWEHSCDTAGRHPACGSGGMGVTLIKWLVRAGLLAVLGVAFSLTGMTTAAAADAPRIAAPHVMASWPFTDPYGSFVESMALGRDGLYVSRTTWGETSNTASVERVPLVGGGAPAPIVSGIDTGLYGLLTGLAFDQQGRLYVARAAPSDTVQSAVFRVGPHGKLTSVVDLPSDSFPNGLAFYGDYLYVADSELGAIWRVRPEGRAETQTVPWLQDPALAPVTSLGANGITFRGNTVYVAQYDRGQILSATIRANGSPGPLHVWAEDPALVTADGIAFDTFGNLWVATTGDGATSSGGLAVVTPAGHVRVLAENLPALDYPTQPVVALPWSILVSNGSYFNGAPSVVGWWMLPF